MLDVTQDDNGKRQGSHISTEVLESQRALCESIMDRERELGQEEATKEALGGAASLWCKNKRTLKLDYNEQCDYESWFLTKFKAEHVPLSKPEAFEDLRKLNISATISGEMTSSTVDRSMHSGRERKRPKHMQGTETSWRNRLFLTPGAENAKIATRRYMYVCM